MRRGHTSCCVKTERFNARLQQVLIELLDDPAPVVRQALLSEFQRGGPAAALFLQRLADSPNRILSFYARGYLTELRFADPVAEFRGFIRSLNYELETGVFLLSRIVRADLDIGAFSEQLDTLASSCRELIIEPSNVREKCRVLNRVLFHDYGFRGDSERSCDPRNDLIDQVLLRKKGTPASLCIVYLLVAHRLGIDLEPVVLPSHFVVGCFTDAEPFFIDAYEQGALRTAPSMNALLRSQRATAIAARLAPSPVREVLCRCCRNLVAHYETGRDLRRAQLFAEFAGELDA